MFFVGILYGVFVRIFGKGIPCLFRVRTGLLCPACGITRMMTALGRLDLQTAFSENPFMLLSLPFLVFLLWKSILIYLKEGSIRIPGRLRALSAAWIAGAVLFGITRNFC